ncbi:hypothetical protein GGR57DRAFT_487616 [Xylariaceae sp. FL1272]|nr:hypothetical protein GGR57DRAFT_487616 [Xylariaceae sp. FL1272]
MRSIRVKDGKGDADALYINDHEPDPTPGTNDVIVTIKCFGLNRMDIMQREAKYPYPLPAEAGDIMGVEFSGIVAELGSQCSSNFRVGDEVFGLAYGGAYAEKIRISENMLMNKPESLSFEEAAGIPETFFTALQAVYLVGGLTKGQSVLIHAGASGVGQAAIQISKLLGAKSIFTTAGTDSKCELCKSLGADFSINYKHGDSFDAVVSRETQGRGVDLIIDMVGRDYWHRNVASCAMDSRIVLVALMSGGIVDECSFRALMNKRISILPTTLRTRSTAYQKELRDVFLKLALPAFTDKRLKVTIDNVFSWKDVSKAHRRMESNANAGKIICTVD